MCARRELLAAHDVVSAIPDKIELSQPDLDAIVVVLRLLSRLLEDSSPEDPKAQAHPPSAPPRSE